MVREESHLDDMRAAIRGDFERLAERRGSQELMQEVDASTSVDTGPPPESDASTADVPLLSKPEAPPAADAPPAAEIEPAAATPPAPADEDEEAATAEPVEEKPRSWLARLLGS